MGTKIEWAEETWNPTRGCTPLSPGCRRCYAERQAHRMAGAGGLYEGLTRASAHGPKWTGEVRLVREALNDPRHWNAPREVFVDSMSDLFHPDVPDGFIMDVWRIMAVCYWHTFIVLTKRAERMRDWVTRFAQSEEVDDEPRLVRGPAEIRQAYTSARAQLFADMIEGSLEGEAYPIYDWIEGMRWLPSVLPNVVLGVTCENQKCARERVPLLVSTPAACRILSIEPMLERVDIAAALPAGWNAATHPNINGVIVGGESGPGAEPVNAKDVRYVRDQCAAAGVDFFFKQWGGYPKNKLGRVLDGRTYDALPWRRAAWPCRKATG